MQQALYQEMEDNENRKFDRVRAPAQQASVADEIEKLAALRDQGWDVPDSQANFVWLPLGDRSTAFAEHVRPLAVRPFPEGVRVTIGAPEANDRLVAAAGAFHRGSFPG